MCIKRSLQQIERKIRMWLYTPIQSWSRIQYLGVLFLRQNLNDWLLSADKSSRLPCCSSAGISGTRFCALNSWVYCQVAVGVLILVTVIKNRHLTYFFRRNHLNIGIKFTSLGSANTCYHPRALLSFVHWTRRTEWVGRQRGSSKVNF